jgi:hypothetical protein
MGFVKSRRDAVSNWSVDSGGAIKHTAHSPPILASRVFLLEAAETILGYFGFDGTAFKRKIRNSGSSSTRRN